MSKEDKIINTLIDKHYNEAYDTNVLKENKNIESLENKIEVSVNKMDLLDDMDFSFDIDTLKIIEQAEQIQARKNSIEENLYFIIASVLILSIFGVVFICIGIKSVIYFEIALICIMPWSLIPLSIYGLRGHQDE